MIATLVPTVALLVAFQNTPDDAAKKSAQDLARKCAEATVTNDVATVIDLTHPQAVAALGGREKAIKRTQDELKKAEQDGVKMLSFDEVKPPAKIHVSKQAQYCVVPIAFRIKIGDKKFRLRTALIATSIDSGKTWKFVDLSMGEKNVRRFLPDIPAELEFPPKADLIPEEQEAK